MIREEKTSKYLKMVGKSVAVGLLAVTWLAGVILLSVLAGVEAKGYLYGSPLYFKGVTGVVISFVLALGFVVGTLVFFMTLDTKRVNKKLEDSSHGR